MSYYSEASLVMIPSGVKDGKVYSAKPVDGSGDLTFSRGSDIEATRVASNGYIEKAKVNLLLQSNSFDTTWANSNTTETGGQAGYDGTNNAWLIEKTATASARILQAVAVTGVQTFSVYAKAGSLNWISMLLLGSGIPDVWFDLSNGTIGANSDNINTKIESVGNGFYRCSISYNVTIAEVRIYPAEANGSAAAVAGNIIIQDAQLNYGLVAQDYVETTTTSVVSGITNDMPRLDYSGGVSCPSLLLEPSRQNYATQSEYIGAWAQSATIGTDNFAVSPEGVQNASKVSASLTSATHFIQLTGGAVGNTATISLFAKADTGSYIQLTNPYSGGIFANFDVATGVVGTKGASCISSDIEDYGNGWYRCIAVFDNTGFNSNIYRHYIVPSASAAFGLSWLPASDTSLFIYGHSWEAGSYSTSYIPTYGTSNSRLADSCHKTGISSLIGQTEGTIFLEIERKDGTDAEPVWLSDGTYANYIYFVTGNTNTRFIGVTGGSQWNITIAALSKGVHKIAGAYKQNDIVLYVDGVNVGEDTTANIPTCSLLGLGYENGNVYNNADPYKQVLLFKTRLSNADLATLTA